MEMLPEECQLLPPDHEQERDGETLRLEVETLYLLAAKSGRKGRTVMREGGVYVVVRELHLKAQDGKVREWCERIVDLLMGEEGEATKDEGEQEGAKVAEVTDRGEEDEEDEIVPIF